MVSVTDQQYLVNTLNLLFKSNKAWSIQFFLERSFWVLLMLRWSSEIRRKTGNFCENSENRYIGLYATLQIPRIHSWTGKVVINWYIVCKRKDFRKHLNCPFSSWNTRHTYFKMNKFKEREYNKIMKEWWGRESGL